MIVPEDQSLQRSAFLSWNDTKYSLVTKEHINVKENANLTLAYADINNANVDRKGFIPE